MELEALVFDAYGTLFDVQSVNARCEEFWPGQGARVSERWRNQQLEYSWLRSLMGRYADFETVTAEALEHACEALGMACAEWQAAALLAAYRELRPHPEAAGVLRAIEGRRRIILSNGTPDMLEAVVRNAGFESCLEAVLSVDAVGVFKPDPRVYRYAADHLRLEPGRIGFVSSNSWDACGAASFGFTVFWVNRSGLPGERVGAEPSHVLTDLTGLFRYLP